MAELRRKYGPHYFNDLVRALGGFADPAPETTSADTDTLTVADSGRTFICTKGSATQTFTLPLASTLPGMKARFVCGSAAGEILINPNVADQISIKGLVDHSTSVKPTAGTGVKNTAATNVLGDYMVLESDGVNTWHEISGAGIWASQ
jgi:hypothetical protein